MKIVTWNVNGIRAVAQKGLREFMEQEQPDFLCLQETKAHPDQLEKSIAQIEGWIGFWSAAGRPGYSGTVTFCREEALEKLGPIEVSHGFGIPKFDAEGRMVVIKTKLFTLYNVYFPNGGSGEDRHQYKQEFLKRFAHHLVKKAAALENIILVGDYNVAYLDQDVYNPKELASESGFLPEERRWMEDFLKKGFVDSFRHFHPDEKNRYTWWSYFQNARVANRGWRIDHICVSQSLEKSLLKAEILDQQMGSDHCPVLAVLDPKRIKA